MKNITAIYTNAHYGLARIIKTERCRKFLLTELTSDITVITTVIKRKTRTTEKVRLH